MTKAPDVRKKPRRWWVRAARWFCGVLLLAAGGIFVRHQIADHRATRELEAALTELDNRDPGWRLEQIEAARAVVPDAENSALLVVAAAKDLPDSWPESGLVEDLPKVEPNHRLSDDMAKRVREALGGDRPRALELSRQLPNRPRGRHRIAYQKNVMMTILEDQQRSRAVALLWRLEAARLSEAGDTAGALRAARGTFNAGRSIGDEPLCISQLVRTAVVVQGAEVVERALGQGEAADADLARWQALALDEDSQPSYLLAARGERAFFHALLTALGEGEVGMWELTDGKGPGWDDHLLGWRVRHVVRAQHPFVLDLLKRRIEVAALPPESRAAIEEQLDADKREVPASRSLAMILPNVAQLGESFRRRHAMMRGLAAAVAAERFRLAHKRWPARLDELVPKLLPAVPTDPYDGRPLRLAVAAEGIVIYAVGKDQSDDGGQHCDNPTTRGCDLSFRLYDPDRRRQPPPARPPEKEADDDEAP